MLEVLTQRQIDLIRATIPRMKNPTPYNFYLHHIIIALPLYMGINAQDMCLMKVNDVHLQAGYIQVRSRRVTLHPEMRKLVRKYLAYRSTRLPPGTESDSFLLKRDGMGNNRGEYPVTIRGLLGYYRDIRKVSHVNIAPKVLRDTFGYHLALTGAPHTVIMGAMACRYDTALRYIKLASKTIPVEEWYTEAIVDILRPYGNKPCK